MQSSVLLVLFVCVATAMRINSVPGNGQYNDDMPDYQRNAMCFGLARRTRTQTVGVPFLYNTRTGQNAPMPGNLHHMDPTIIAKMDRDGWEVRTRPVSFPRAFYFRVRVCCPWDVECRRRTTPVAPVAPVAPVERRVQQPVQSRGPCENGGQLVIKAGVKTCVCSGGFRGQVCQYPDLISRVQGKQQGYRGRARPAPTPRVFTNMIKQVDMWKQKMLAGNGRMKPSATPPRLSQKQHMILNSMSGPWSPRVAAWQQQAVRSKMAELCRRRRLLALRNQRLQAEVMRAMQLSGGNPYSAQAMQMGGGNPYSVRRQPGVVQKQPVRVSGVPYSTRVNQQLAAVNQQLVAAARRPAYNTARGPAYTTVAMQPTMATPQGSGNPYSRVRPYVEPPQFGRPVNRAILHPEPRTPWDMDPFSQNPNMMSDPRSMVHPLQYLKTVLRPEARTPWDMDPFQKNPALTGDPRAHAALEKERQLMALAYYRYMRNQQGTGDVTSRPSMRREYPGPAPSPAVNGMDLSAQLPPLTQDTTNNNIETISLDFTDGQAQSDLDLNIGDEDTESQQDTQDMNSDVPSAPEERPLGPAESSVNPTEPPLGPSDESMNTDGPLGPTDMPQANTDGPLGPSDMNQEESTDGPLGPSDVDQETTDGPLGPSDMNQEATDGPLGPSDVNQESTDGPLGPTDMNDDSTDGPLGPTDMPQEPTSGPLGPADMPQEPTMGPTDMPMGPMDNMRQRHIPTPEEMAKMESCRSSLEPEMDKCLADFNLNFAQFMNPDYMALAKEVCVQSAVVGPCITSKDSVCGTGNQVLLTRKMIQSVMQMMGMVCQQIMARGDTPMPPVPQQTVQVPTNLIPPFKQSRGPTNPAPESTKPVPQSSNPVLESTIPILKSTNPDLDSTSPVLKSTNPVVESTSPVLKSTNPALESTNPGPATGSTNKPVIASEPTESTNQPDATAEPTNKMPEREPSTEDTEIPALAPTEKPNHKKFTDSTKSDLKSKPTASPTVHSSGFTAARHDAAPAHDTSHDAAHPVIQQEMLLLGYPAWLVIALGGLLLLVLLLSGFVCCLCVRKRSQKTIELEVCPEPMDEKKLAIIGVPPPLYFTTAVNQTQEVDDLSLPPLELTEDSDDAEDKSHLEEDADDESDDKTEEEEKKEKKKPKKDQQ